MYNIKSIEDKDFFKLLELNYELHKLLPMQHSLSAATVCLCREIDVTNKLVIGLYYEDSLVGFINGYEYTKEIFWFSNIYVLPKHRYKVKNFLEYAEKEIVTMGYTSWLTHSLMKQGKNMLTKFGAKELR